MIQQLISELEHYLGPAAGFVVKDLIARKQVTPDRDHPKHRKMLVDSICDEVLHLSVARRDILRSKLYSIMQVEGYTKEFEYWR